jgi:3-ketosteroid 9alpha-monooxygenase subunit B
VTAAIRRAHTLSVREVIDETPQARSIVLDVPESEQAAFRYVSGQFLTLRLPVGPDTWCARCYSISSSPATGERLKITVKRIQGGVGSNWICDRVSVGDSIDLLPPAGIFTWQPGLRKLLMFAGGSGITPVISIVKTALHASDAEIVLMYANSDDRSVIFAGELRELEHRFPGRLLTIHLLESTSGLPTAVGLRRLAMPYLDSDAAYICGPGPFMDLVAAMLADSGMSRDRIKVEKFRSLESDPFVTTTISEVSTEAVGAAAMLTVTMDGERLSLRWPGDARLLDTLIAAGLDPPYSCREGACSACACRLVAGRVEMVRNEVLEQEDIDEGWVLACQSVPVSDEVEVSYD